MKKITAPTTLLILILLLSGCNTLWSGSSASTPTIVPLAAETGPEDTPAPQPTATEQPPPSPSPTSSPISPTATPSPVPVSPTSTQAATAPAAVGLPPTAAPAIVEATSTAVSSLSGAWDFSFGTMTLTQRDLAVEGTYQWYGGLDTGRIDGTMVMGLDLFQGIWVSDRNPNSQKLLRWNVAEDRTGFSGQSTGGDTGQQWCGVRAGQPLPAGCGFSGDWQLRFGSPPGATGQASLVQTGPTVQGTYTNNAGETGVIVDAVVTVPSTTEVKLNGTWRSDQGAADRFEWRLDLTTGRTFQGRRDPGNSEWCGWRPGTDEPEQCGSDR